MGIRDDDRRKVYKYRNPSDTEPKYFFELPGCSTPPQLMIPVLPTYLPTYLYHVHPIFDETTLYGYAGYSEYVR